MKTLRAMWFSFAAPELTLEWSSNDWTFFTSSKRLLANGAARAAMLIAIVFWTVAVQSGETAETGQKNESMAKVRGGIGAYISKVPEDSFATVVDVVPGTPAAEPGALKGNDKIVAIVTNGVELSLSGLPEVEIVSLLGGPPGTDVGLRVIRAHDSSEEVLHLKRVLLRSYGEAPANANSTSSWPSTRSPITALPVMKRVSLRMQRLREITNSLVCIPSTEAWQRVQTGMTGADVIKILGKPMDRYGSPDGLIEFWTYGWLAFESAAFPDAFYFEIKMLSDRVSAKVDPFGGDTPSRDSPSRTRLLSPPDQQVFSHVPRFLDLRWLPSSGQYPLQYAIEVELWVSDKWSTQYYESEEPFLSLVAIKPGKYRWKVKARNMIGEGDWSPYRQITFEK